MIIRKLIPFILVFLLFAACVTQKSVSQKAEQESEPQPMEGGWSILLKGIRTDTLTAACFNEAREHADHYVEIKLEKKGELRTYNGMPLYLVIAMVDGEDSEHPYVFARELWQTGYDITLTSADGYAVTFNTAEYAFDCMILADQQNGEPVTPVLVGDIPGNLQVKELVSIECALKQEEAAKPFIFSLVINETRHDFSLPELEQSPLYTEGRGSFTTSAGTTRTDTYGGIPLAQFINLYMELKPDTTVRVVAMDDYEMDYRGEEFLDRSAGTWILAFKMNSEYLPLDPGYIRTVKIGPQVPNIDSHLSVKMIKQVVVQGRAYRDFSLAITGRMDVVLDRQTLQSGINCHKKQVFFERKETRAYYTGIPLWRLLAYADDADYAPHKQDKAIISYNEEAALTGYKIEIVAGDGFSITLDSREVTGNDDVIIAMYKEGGELPGDEWPLIIVWDKDAALVPGGIKPVKMISRINLIF